MSDQSFKGWAIVEIMGFRKRAGQVEEVDIAGGKLLRIDIPTCDGAVTEFYGASAIFSLRPCSEDVARGCADQLGEVRPIAPTDWRPQIAGPEDYSQDPADYKDMVP